MTVRDANGKALTGGDIVRCISAYPSIEKGGRREIVRIEEPNIVLRNPMSPVGTSLYRPDCFVFVRHVAYNRMDRFHIVNNAAQQEITPMFHIAILMIPDTDVVDHVNGSSSLPGYIAGRNKAEIQERVKDRITRYPHEKWLICSGNTIAETQSPIVFRSL